MNGRILILGAAALLTAAISGLGQGGTGVLYVDGKEVDRQSMERGTPITFAEKETFDVGLDARTGVALNGSATVIARVTGIALIALGLACWPGPPLLGMLTYGAAITLYLVYLGLVVGMTGVLLWPAVALHAILTALLIRTSCITTGTTGASPT